MDSNRNSVEDLRMEMISLNSPQKTILIANRGEIAIRIIRSSHELGLRTIAIYSHEDRLSMHRYKVNPHPESIFVIALDLSLR